MKTQFEVTNEMELFGLVVNYTVYTGTRYVIASFTKLIQNV